jgi:hypothetical protein
MSQFGRQRGFVPCSTCNQLTRERSGQCDLCAHLEIACADWEQVEWQLADVKQSMPADRKRPAARRVTSANMQSAEITTGSKLGS